MKQVSGQPECWRDTAGGTPARHCRWRRAAHRLIPDARCTGPRGSRHATRSNPPHGLPRAQQSQRQSGDGGHQGGGLHLVGSTKGLQRASGQGDVPPPRQPCQHLAEAVTAPQDTKVPLSTLPPFLQEAGEGQKGGRAGPELPHKRQNSEALLGPRRGRADGTQVLVRNRVGGLSSAPHLGMPAGHHTGLPRRSGARALLRAQFSRGLWKPVSTRGSRVES